VQALAGGDKDFKLPERIPEMRKSSKT